jgi:hypothetical protein
MKLAAFAIGLMALTYFPVGSLAQTAKQSRQSQYKLDATSNVSSTSKRNFEDYYFHVSLGFPINHYPTETQEAVKDLSNMSGVTHIPLNAEFGVYWPLGNDRTIIGWVAGATGDNFTKGGNRLNLEVGQLTISAQHYITNTIGDGLFVRGDVGIAGTYLDRSVKANEGGNEISERSSGNVGFTALGSVGYALPLSSGTSLSFSLSGNYRRLPGYKTGEFKTGDDIFERGDYTSVVFGANLLW